MSHWEDPEDVDGRTTQVVPVTGGRARMLSEAYGDPHVRAVGDGTRFVYASTWMREAPATTDCVEGAFPPECHFVPSATVFFWSAGKRRRLKIHAPAEMALSGNRLAVIPAADIWTDGRMLDSAVEPADAVEIYDIRTSALLRTIPTAGVRAIALAGGLLAMLSKDDTGWRIGRYSLRSHRLDYSLTVPSNVGRNVAAGNGWIVYSVGSEIRRVDAGGRNARIWKGRYATVDLEVDRRRVVWGVNGPDERGHVYTATLPGSPE